MHRRFATRRTSVKRQSRGFTASQSRYLKLRYTHIWVTWAHRNPSVPEIFLNLPPDDGAMPRRSTTCQNTITSQVMMILIETMKQLWVYIHPFWNLRFYRAVNTINLLNLRADEEAMRRRFTTRRTSVKRVGRGFTSSQSRYLKPRLQPLLGDLSFYKSIPIINSHIDSPTDRRFMKRRSFTVSKSTHFTSAQCPYNNHPITTCLLHPLLEPELPENRYSS